MLSGLVVAWEHLELRYLLQHPVVTEHMNASYRLLDFDINFPKKATSLGHSHTP